MKPFSFLLSAMLALSLAACGKPAEKQAADVPAADPVAAPAPAAPAAVAATPVSYTCDPAMALSVSYINEPSTDFPDGSAVVTLDGKEFTLANVQAGSGARYITQKGRSDGASLVWWTKGEEGTLYEGKADNPEAEEVKLASCKQA